MRCTVDFYVSENGNTPVKDFLEGVSVSQRTKISRDILLISEYGSDLHYPYADTIKGKRYKGMHELRTKTADGIFRIFYFFVIGSKCILLHGFQKKTQKTPKKELETALARMDDWKRRNENGNV